MGILNKNGVIKNNDFYETGGVSITDTSKSYSYKPVANTDNSCIGGALIDFTNYLDRTENIKFHIRLLLEYSGNDASSTSGTFNTYFQGSRYNRANKAFEWTGSNPATTALNDKQEMKSLVVGKNGHYWYDTTFTITPSWLVTYSQVYVGIRTNYGNGTGSLTISNVSVYEEIYNGDTAKINPSFIVSNSYYEY